MAGLVREIMTTDPVTVDPEATVEEVVRLMRRHELPGLPVVDANDHLLGIVTESDLVLSDDEGDLHIPHYLELFGGIVFLGLVPLAGPLVALVALPLALVPLRLVRTRSDGPGLIKALIGTARLQLVFGVLLALGLWWSWS